MGMDRVTKNNMTPNAEKTKVLGPFLSKTEKIALLAPLNLGVVLSAEKKMAVD